MTRPPQAPGAPQGAGGRSFFWLAEQSEPSQRFWLVSEQHNTREKPSRFPGRASSSCSVSEACQALPDSFSRSAASCSSLASEPPADDPPVELLLDDDPPRLSDADE